MFPGKPSEKPSRRDCKDKKNGQQNKLEADLSSCAETDLKKKKIRRSQRCRNALKKCKIMVDNVRGVKSKINSIKDIIDDQEPTIIALTETKLNEEDLIEIDGYTIKRRDRVKEGGGVMIAYKDGIKNIVKVVREEHEEFEMLWIKINNTVVNVRIGIVYMPQEDTKTVKQQFLYFLH